MKMKNLLLAAVGFAGFALAGSAFAQCGTGLSNLSAWTGFTQSSGTLAVTAPGLDTSACKLDSALNAGASAFASATVNFLDSQDEPTYRAQFLVNVDAITGLDSFNGAQLFTANSNSPAPATNPTLQLLKLAIVGNGTGKNLTVIAACNNGGSNKCSTSTPLAAGVNRVEIQVSVGGGTSGFVNVWVNNTTEGTPTKSITGIDNSAWVGMRKAILGLSAPTKTYGNGGHIASFDSFDSRRQTFIGGP